MERKDFDFEIDSILDQAFTLIPAEHLPRLPFMQEAPDVPEWYSFEHKLWDLGEQIRLLVLSCSKQLNKQQAERVIEICRDDKAMRGRQSFVLLLGKTRYKGYADKLVPLLSDSDVDGHVIDTLYKMHAFTYREQIEPFTNHNRTWIRNEAKRYIQKCGADSSAC